jgi:hypothetical protein
MEFQMRTSSVRFSVLAAFGLVLAAPVIPSISTAAQAQSIEVGPGGVRVNPDSEFRRGPPGPDYRYGPRWRISERDAVRIARRHGMIDINRVVDAGREWRVVGMNRRGSFMRVVVNARSGDVIRVVRGRG